MQSYRVLWAATVCLFSAATAFCQADPNPPRNVFKDYNYTFFNLPNGASGIVSAINNWDEIAGTYYATDPCCAPNAPGQWFLRYPGGKIEVFSIANANGTTMRISGVNDRGEVLGHYMDKTTGNITGFIRHADGTMKTFTLGGATENTIPTGLNNEGNVFGVLVSNNSMGNEPFLRYPDGQYLTFAVPGAPADSYIFTENINDRGVGVGTYPCAANLGSVCGFYGKPGGKIETFNYPPNGINLFEINNQDEIGGVAFLPAGGDDFFIRKPDGKMDFFGTNKIPHIGAITSDLLSINDRGDAISSYYVEYEPRQGGFPEGQTFSYDFIRSPDGKISSYDPPKQPGTLQGTVINNRGTIAGQTISQAKIGLFVLVPKHFD